MKRKSLLLTLFVSIGLSVSAQQEVGTFSLIPRLGMTLANMTDNDVYVTSSVTGEHKLESKNKAGLLVGVDAEYQVLRPLSLSAGLHYAILGSRYPDYQDGDADTKKYVGYRDWHTNLHYINIPLVANFYVAEGLALKTGVQASVLLDATTEFEATEFRVNDNGSKEYGDTEKVKEDLDLRKLDFSIPVGISYEYMNVILDARYNIGLTKLFKDDIAGSKNSFFTFTAGYRFRL